MEQQTLAQINFGWLVRLRWATIVGQVLTIAGVRWVMGIAIPMAPLGALVALGIATNLAALAWQRIAVPRPWWLLAVMAFDLVLFSALLYFTGGPLNPFSFLYLVPIALAAITLRPLWTWALVALSLACLAFLFAWHRPLLLNGDHARHMALHLQGMWVALGVAAGFMVHFVMRVQRALARRDEELAISRGLAAQRERLASLATLAAGAAHELATPLSTIAVVARELEQAIVAPHPVIGGAAVEDVRLMRREVERCRRILERMRVDAGDSAGERFAPVPIADLIAECIAGEGDGQAVPAVRVEYAGDTERLTTVVPRRAFAQALRGLVENACQASPLDATVSLRVARDEVVGADRRVVFEVADRGSGIPADILPRLGEPFFTTKPPGQGMGLGIFLARAVIERLGGQLAIRSTPGEGTTATLSLPVAEGGR